MDVRRSRRGRLASIPPDHLLLMAREWVLSGFNRNTSVAHVTRALESAAARGSEESGWLLDKLRSKGDIPEFGKYQLPKLRWFAEIMATEDSPRAQFYRGRALRWLGDGDSGLKLLWQSAEAGFAPAMSELGVVVRDRADGIALIRKAAELNDPDGLFLLANRVKEGRFELLCEAASRGHADSTCRLAGDFSDRLSSVEVATFGARFVLYSGNHVFVGPGIEDMVQRSRAGSLGANDVAVLYAAGRELEGYDQLWDAGRHPNEVLIRCVDIYLAVMHRARRAALQTVAGLREIGLPRDVAVLIGRIVYETRTDAWAWWQEGARAEEPATKKRK